MSELMTKTEVVQAVIDGVEFQRFDTKYGDKQWRKFVGGDDQIQNIVFLIENFGRYQFRLPIKLQYARIYFAHNLLVQVWNSFSSYTESDVENFPSFSSWASEKIEIIKK